MINDRQWDVLAEVLALGGRCRHPWLVSGSVAAALYEVPIEPADIDIQTTAQGAYELGRLFAGWESEPVRLSGTALVRSHFGTYLSHGVPVEVIGDMHIRTDTGWVPGLHPEDDRQVLQTRVGAVPVASLRALIGQYRLLGRPDRVALCAAAPLADDH